MKIFSVYPPFIHYKQYCCMRNQLKLRLWERKRIPVVLLFQFAVMTALAQIQVNGKVSGNDGKGIPSVSVQIRTTTFGTVTDANGMYSLSASLKAGNYTI